MSFFEDRSEWRIFLLLVHGFFCVHNTDSLSHFDRNTYVIYINAPWIVQYYIIYRLGFFSSYKYIKAERRKESEEGKVHFFPPWKRPKTSTSLRPSRWLGNILIFERFQGIFFRSFCSRSQSGARRLVDWDHICLVHWSNKHALFCSSSMALCIFFFSFLFSKDFPVCRRQRCSLSLLANSEKWKRATFTTAPKGVSRHT